MRFREALADVLGADAGLRVVETLVRSPSKEFTGREVSRLSGTSPSKTIARLNRMLAHGIVERRSVGSTQLWRVNRTHALFKPLEGLIRVDEAATRELNATLRAGLRGTRPFAAVLFGSTARSEATAGSDIDILVVAEGLPQKNAIIERLLALNHETMAHFGAQLSPLVYTKGEWSKKRNTPLGVSIRRDAVDVKAGSRDAL